MKIQPPLLALFALVTACSSFSRDPGSAPPQQESVGQVSAALLGLLDAGVYSKKVNGVEDIAVGVTNEGSQPTTTWKVTLSGYGAFYGDVGGGQGAYSCNMGLMTITPGPNGTPVLEPNGKGHANVFFLTENVPTIVSATATTGLCGPDTCADGCCVGFKCYTFQTPPYCGTGGGQCSSTGCVSGGSCL
jgi:hypothetical protein